LKKNHILLKTRGKVQIEYSVKLLS